MSQQNIDWDLLGIVLVCPACQTQSLSYEDRSAVVCRECASRYPVINGIVDFLANDRAETPAFYRNELYRVFTKNLLEIHKAHYDAGGVSNLIEDRMKRHSFDLIQSSSGIFVDLGCGTGSDIDQLQIPDGFIGLDSQMGLLFEAKKKHQKLSFVRASLTKMPFKANSLNSILCNAVLEHVYFLEKALENIQGSLSENGRLYVGVPTEGGLAVEMARLVTSSRNAKILGMSRKESAKAQRMDHCNTVFSIESSLRKFFEIEEASLWPFRIGTEQLNLFKSFRLKHLQTT